MHSSVALGGPCLICSNGVEAILFFLFPDKLTASVAGNSFPCWEVQPEFLAEY